MGGASIFPRMSRQHRITILAGDGIGPEVMVEAVRILEAAAAKFGFSVSRSEHLVGGAAIDATGHPLPTETVQVCEKADAILFGSVGGPKWENLPPEIQPERGALLPLRKHFGLFANLRPGVCLPALTHASPVKQELIAAGYKGEKVVLLGPSTIPSLHAQSLITNDLLIKMGFNVDYLALEWGTVVQRRASKEPSDKGGWSIFITNLTSLNNVFVPAQIAIRSGPAAWFGWPDAPKLEELREEWLAAPNEAEQKRIGREMQLQAFRDVPYVPTGLWMGYTCFNNALTGIQNGWPVFWGVRRA